MPKPSRAWLSLSPTWPNRERRYLLMVMAAGGAALGCIALVRFVFAHVWPRFIAPLYPDFPYQAIATLIVAFVAFFTVRATQRGNAERLAQERELAERKALQEEFADILNRFANQDNLALRVNAALRLSAIARRPFPGMGTEPTRDNYPLFVEAATQLVAALRTEEAPEVIEAAQTALAQLVGFAAKDRSLLWRLVEELIRTNRAALISARRALADTRIELPSAPATGAMDSDSEALSVIKSLFGDIRQGNAIAFLVQVWGQHPAYLSQRARRSGDGEATARELDRLANRIEQLHALRDTLILALKRIDQAQVDRNPLDLHQTYLAKSSLVGAHWAEANLIEAHLEQARLIGAHLDGAILVRARLTGASLEGADLTEAQMVGAHLVGAQLAGAHLTRVDLREATLSGARLAGVDLTGARLGGADLSGADLAAAKLVRSRMERANLSEAQLSGADMREACLEGARIEGADLAGASLGGAILWGAEIDEKTRVVNAKWTKADFRNPENLAEVDSELKARFLRNAIAQGDPRFTTPGRNAPARANTAPSS